MVRIFFRVSSCGVLFLACLFVPFFGTGSALGSPPAKPSASSSSVSSSSSIPLKGTPAPAVSDEPPHPRTWRFIEAVMFPEDPARSVHIRLLRPISWIRETGAYLGHTIYLNLNEMGIEGPAKITSVTPVGHFPKGPGRIVLATMTRMSDDVVTVKFENSHEELHVTAGHLLYSASRDDWVKAGELHPGEKLKTATGTVTVASIAPFQ